ncbi:MAG: hypothetical protein D4R97_02625 [Bacteroidetes bacterium]|nr:MAG: hypothetical protein D4R97_02625 [Bacteroidota bacterium]
MTIRLFVIFIFFTWWTALPANASVELDFQTVDMLTYRCYNEQKWDSVILVGKQALRQNIDYYYLRVRLGISYYQIKEYFPAVTHLKKARQFNSGDAYVADYLYLAYINTNRKDEANLLRAELPAGERDTAYTKPGFVEQIHFEAGYTLSSDRAPKNLGTLMGKDSIYGEQNLYGNNFYGNLGLKLRVSNRLNFTLAYNYLNFAKTKYIQYGRGEDHFVSRKDTSWGWYNFYSFPWVIYDTNFSYHVSQHEVHIGATITLPLGIKIMPAFHWIHVSYPMINTSFRTDTIHDTAFYTSVDNTYHTFPFPRLVYSFVQKDTAINNYLVALRISKDLGRFSIALSGSWSDLNGKTQTQAGVLLTYYPLGNLNFYGTTTATGFFQGNESRLLLSQVLGARITPWMWGELNFYYGDYTNANIFNGAIVYNNSDKIDYRGGATLVFLAGRHIELSLNYQYFRKESLQLYYIKTRNSVTNEIKEIPQTQYNPYNTNSIIGGITWKL